MVTLSNETKNTITDGASTATHSKALSIWDGRMDHTMKGGSCGANKHVTEISDDNHFKQCDRHN